MVDFHPKPQAQPITLREALKGVCNTERDIEESRYPFHSICHQILCKMKQWEKGDKYHPNQALFSLKRLAWDRPSRTVLKDQGVKNKACQCCHPTEHRRLTIPELKRISSFPDNFQLTGTTAKQWARIGNSVPPKFIGAIATHIYHAFLSPSDTQEVNHMPLDFINKPINPDTPRLFTCGSSFSGVGGSSLGVKWAGGKVLFAIEWDDNAVATYRLNHHGTPVLHRDISTVTTEELLDLTGLKPGELDVFETSPPCQGFSTSGKRQIDDPRNSLFKESVRLIRGLQPKVLIMENVSGMVKGYMKHVFAIIMRELKASGYQVKCQLMNAMYFGVPQSRERVIFIGVRNDLGIESSHPVAQNAPIPLREAFEDVHDDGTGNRVGPHTKIWQAMKSVKPGNTQPGHYSHTRLQLNAPSCTLKRAGGLGHYHFWHPTEHRVITLTECKRIASFPDAFQFVGKINDAWDRIGNSVPPRFMQSIAEHIYEYILSKVVERAEVPTHV